MTSTDELYGSQDFMPLIEVGCVAVYEMHIDMMEKQLDEVVHCGKPNYTLAYKLQKGQDFWRSMIRQAMIRGMA